MKRSAVQILVAVAMIQGISLKTEVEKGFTQTEIGRGSVGPKSPGYFQCHEDLSSVDERELC